VTTFVTHTLKYVAAEACQSMVVSIGTGDPGVDDKGVYGWGSCKYEELKLQADATTSSPFRISPRFLAYEDAMMLSCTNTYSAVLTESGRV